MTEKQTGILVFGEDWGSHPSSTQHLISNIMHKYPVIWVNSIGLRSPKLTWYDLKRVIKKLISFLRPRDKAPQNIKSEGGAPLSLINPFAFPFYGNRFVRAVNARLLTWQVKKQLRKHGLSRIILWSSLPSAADLVGKCGELATIYYAGDDFSALEGVDHAPIEKMEEQLATHANSIIIPGANLAHKFDPDKSFIIEHGCDFKLFSEPRQRASDVDWSKPTAGFYGSLDKWLDQDLICKIAKRNPHWQILLIGHQKTDISEMLKRPNITFLGPRPHDQLPCYSQHWDISLLPFKDNPQIRACNPLKLREYLAAGTPVASTYFDAAGRYKHVVDICTTPQDFEKSFLQALKDSKNNRSQRQQAVKRTDWSSRSNDIMLLIDTLQNEALNQKKTNPKSADCVYSY